MNKEEINEILEELQQVNPSHLNDNSLRLYKAIMSIADERDDLKKRTNKAIEYIEQQHRFIPGCDIYLITNWDYVIRILKGEE